MIRLRGNEHKGALDEPADVIAGFVLGSLERIGSQVEQRWQANWTMGCADRAKPWAFCSMIRPSMVVAKTADAVDSPVEDSAALIGALAGEKVALI